MTTVEELEKRVAQLEERLALLNRCSHLSVADRLIETV
ncbi:MAG: hypothetical protein JWR69_3032, partial [Pedosphaera sp.]|nr:hypothetical protein [Pedosphaera sp.]